MLMVLVVVVGGGWTPSELFQMAALSNVLGF